MAAPLDIMMPAMIAYLSGRVAGVTSDSVVVDVGGVGYRVFVPGRDLAGLVEGDPAMLHTHLLVRESEVALFGALDRATLELFLLLLGVNGVGPRLALAMLSTWPADVLAGAIAAEDVAALTRVPGVGRKTAERVVVDLRGRLGAWSSAGGLPGGLGGPAPADVDVETALIALGYSAAEARRAVAAAAPDPTRPLEARVFAALRHLGGG
jgi:holliday junction DNA helicase RuvA